MPHWLKEVTFTTSGHNRYGRFRGFTMSFWPHFHLLFLQKWARVLSVGP